MMARGEVDVIFTGADRIAANGDTANKIGTYTLAVLAAHHGIPLYIVAPSSTVDLGTESGEGIPIEERAGDEVTARFAARNPAFDVTPAELIAAIVTEHGVHRARRRRYAAVAGRGLDGGGPDGGAGFAGAGAGTVKAIILAAGYATRLPPADRLDREAAAPGRRPADDRLGLRQDRGGHRRHPPRHERALRRGVRDAGRQARGCHRPRRRNVSNEDRLGAIGDIAFVLERTGIDDDLLVVAGDNLFDFGLPNFAAFWELKWGAPASAVAVYDCGDIELATHYGVVEVDGDDRLVGFEEKPSEPASTLVATADYLYHRDSRSARRALPRRWESAAISPDGSSPGCTRRSRCTATASTASGTTSAAPSSCSRRTTAGGSARPAAARRVLDAQLARQRAAGPAGRAWSAAATSCPAERSIVPTSSRRGGRGRSGPTGRAAFAAAAAAVAAASPCALEVTPLLHSVTDTCADASYRVSMCCSTCCCRAAASSAPSRAPPSARPARARCHGSLRPCAPAAVRPSPGRLRAAASARAGGSRSPPPGPRSSTTWGPHARLRLEGARAARPRLARRRARGRGRATAVRTTDHVRAARRRAEPRARRPPARAARPRARPAVGATGRAGARAHAATSSPARPRPRRAAAERPRRVPGEAAVRGCVVLVDDVYTTGSTVSAAATALRAAGAVSVEVVTFARAVRR